MQTYTQEDLSNLISEVEQAFNGAFMAKSEVSTAGSTLSKSEEDKEEPKKEEKEEPKAESEEAPAKEEPKSEEHSEESKEAPVAEEKNPEEHKEEAPKAEGQEEGHGYDDEDMEHMHKMYLSMSKPELKAHHDSVKSALDHHGMEKCGDMSMAKSETITVNPELISAQSELSLVKSELAAKNSKVEELQKNLDTVTEILTKLAKKSAPKEKAITSLEFIAKSEQAPAAEKTFTKTEVTKILSTKTQEPTLSKSDRDAINDYYNNGQTNINSIRHLLNGKA